MMLQGSLKCCMTGPAFEQMLQQADASLVQTVMGSVAVLARMRGQQKGQVMDLLGRRGCYHTHAGEQHHLPVRTCHVWQHQLCMVSRVHVLPWFRNPGSRTDGHVTLCKGNAFCALDGACEIGLLYSYNRCDNSG